MNKDEKINIDTETVAPFRVGEWLPSDQTILEEWINWVIEEVKKEGEAKLDPSVEAFGELIQTDPEVFMYTKKMFEQVPNRPPYNETPTHKRQIRHYPMMLRMINWIMKRSPKFNKTGLVGFPINAIIDWPMGTPAGTKLFLIEKVNMALKNILNTWGTYLTTDDSANVLTKDDWFSKTALSAIAGADPFWHADKSDPYQGVRKENGKVVHLNAEENFSYNFKFEPKLPHYGYKSWDDFFTREFNEGVRPVASGKNVITNACESAPYRVAYGVQKRDKFWIKAQPYSLQHMLDNDPLYEKFVGGTVYQAFLSAKSYHRWHSPVKGTIVKAYVVDGSYYAEAISEGFDPAGPNDSQGYITEVATRALIFIETVEPAIGLVCVMPVGMAEVSSCQIFDSKGSNVEFHPDAPRPTKENPLTNLPVEKGQQLGTFHFGGSTHCLFFEKGVELAFDLHGQTPGLNSNNISVNAKLATAVKS